VNDVEYLDGGGIGKFTSVQIQSLNVDPGFFEIFTKDIYTGLWFFELIFIIFGILNNWNSLYGLYRFTLFCQLFFFFFWLKCTLLSFLKLLDLKRRKMIFQIILILLSAFVFYSLFNSMNCRSLFVLIVFQEIVA